MLFDLYFSNTLEVTADFVMISNDLTNELPTLELTVHIMRYLSSIVGGHKLVSVLKYFSRNIEW